VVGGITNAGWSVVDAFCARHGLPSVLPQTPLPRASADEDGFYSLHFSRGVISEARAIARHVQESGSVVRQVSRCGDVGEAAARELAGALPAGSAAGECLPAPLPLGAASWPALVGKAKSLVIWLDARDRAALEALATSPTLDGVAQVYLSASLLGEDAVRLPAALASRTVLATPFVPPDELDRHAARSLVWMKASGIEAPSRRVAVNALFAAVLASDALAMPGVLGSREYFVETIEHMAGRSLNPTAYPSLSFAPGRRFGFEGASLLKPPASPGQPFAKVQEWSAPRS
jgi:hypothetical protein